METFHTEKMTASKESKNYLLHLHVVPVNAIIQKYNATTLNHSVDASFKYFCLNASLRIEGVDLINAFFSDFMDSLTAKSIKM